ncbi:MAG: FKBP-type peptidyl-prolyl cis-trans isomerase [Bacteroidota bacterium]
MKQKIFTLLLIVATGLSACKKNQDQQQDIRSYDNEQIQKYIAANGLTGFTADTTTDGTGKTGIQYKIITQGTGDTLKYSDKVSLVYTLKSFDGKYTSADTINNHMYDFLGYLTKDNLPQGLQLAIHNILRYKNSSMRLLIPSRLAYGINGTGSGSISNVNTRIAGNQCLDYYVHVIGDQSAYDDKVINNYIAANNLSGFSKDFALIDSSGVKLKKYYYYKTVTPGTGVIGAITEFSKVTTTYGGSILNGFSFDFASYTTPTVLTPFNLIDGVSHALENHATTGTSLQILIPSALGYGTAASTGIPSNSVLKFDFTVSGIDL